MDYKPGQLYRCATCGLRFQVTDAADAARITEAGKLAEAVLGGPLGPLCPADGEELGRFAAMDQLDTVSGELAAQAPRC